ncbi:hypothetical protein MP638_002238 [Amoeboaphelidium occidentale]|nr:hypothetical protein MP638_002238 [Amoeboaphelidium occidentale]
MISSRLTTAALRRFSSKSISKRFPGHAHLFKAQELKNVKPPTPKTGDKPAGVEALKALEKSATKAKK